MKLAQLQDFKRWHVCHASGSPLELCACDCVLACWILGWVILPLPMIFDLPETLPISLLMILMPEIYRGLRRSLHRRGLLRCDWLYAATATRPD